MENMDQTSENRTLKKVRSHYKLVITDEDNFEEVARFKLTRVSVYLMLSSVFILMIALTAALIIFTPLKYYLPDSGYGSAKQVREYRQLQMRTDSMEYVLEHQTKYLEDLRLVLAGEVPVLDSTTIPDTQ